MAIRISVSSIAQLEQFEVFRPPQVGEGETPVPNQTEFPYQVEGGSVTDFTLQYVPNIFRFTPPVAEAAFKAKFPKAFKVSAIFEG